MWRTFVFTFLTVPAALLGFVAGWAVKDLGTGILAGAVCFTLFFIAALVNIILTKRYTAVDAALPVLFAVIWSLILVPFSFGVSLFSAPAFIGSALMLAVCMLAVNRGELKKTWLVLPVLIYVYEMLPVNIPGPFDDAFALTGSAARAIPLLLKGRAASYYLKKSGQR